MKIYKKLFLVIIFMGLDLSLATIVPVEEGEIKENKIPFDLEKIKSIKTNVFSFCKKFQDSWIFFENKTFESLNNETTSSVLLFSKIKNAHFNHKDFYAFNSNKDNQIQYLGNIFVKHPEYLTPNCFIKQAKFCAFCGLLYKPFEFNKAYSWDRLTFHKDAIFQLKEIQELHDKKIDDFKTLREQIKDAMAYTYKIHFSVAEKYLEWFVGDLVKVLSNHDCFKYIEIFKILPSYEEDTHFPKKNSMLEAPVPVIVMYPCLIPGTKEEKNKILDPMIQTLVARYKNIASKIVLRDWKNEVVKPRYNLQINDLIYIAGGNGDDKNEYVDAMKKVKELKIEPIKGVIEDPLYTDNYTFIRGYEYEYKPKKVQEKPALETALALLKAKLLQLATQLK